MAPPPRPRRPRRTKWAARHRAPLAVTRLEDRTLPSGGTWADVLQQGLVGPASTWGDDSGPPPGGPDTPALHRAPAGTLAVVAPPAAPVPPLGPPAPPAPLPAAGPADPRSDGPNGPTNWDFPIATTPPRYTTPPTVTVTGNTLVNDPTADGTYAGFTQSETTSLAFGSTVVVGYNDSESFTGFSSSAKFTGFSVSTDGGTTFTDEGALPTSPGGDLGDPVLARDTTSGTVYFSTLSFGSYFYQPAVQVFRSADGVHYSAPVNAAPGISAYDFPDKEWITVDNFAGSGQGNVYLTYTDFGYHPTGIVFSRSTDGGSTWGPGGGVTLATGNVQGSYVVVGPDHSVDVFWLDGNAAAERLLMRQSTDQGVTFGPAVTVATLKVMAPNGDLGLGFRSNAFPHVAVNPVNGDLYVAYNDRGTGTDRSNIYFTQSGDGGATWSSPVQVNDDTTSTDQWQPWVAVKPNGTQVFVGWYDRRLDPANTLIGVFGAVANVNTATHAVAFQPNFRLTTQSFPPAYGRDPIVNSVYMGDYDTASADNTNFYVSWGDNRLTGAAGFNQPDVRFAKVTPAFQVTSASPGSGDFISSPPTDFVVRFDDAYAPSSVTANDLTVNGVTADSVTQTDANTLTFHFKTSPVTKEGPQTLALAAGSVSRLGNGDPLQAYSETFYYDTLRLQVASTSPAAGSAINLPGHLVLHFNEAVDPTTIGTGNLVLSAGTVTSAAAVAGDPTSVDYTIAGPASLDGATLTVTLVDRALKDTDGNPGQGYTASYAANILVSPYPTPLTPVSPLGSLVYDPSVSATIGFVGDTDSFTISLNPGQTASVLVTPDTALQPSVALIGPDGTTVLGSAAAAGAGAAAILQTVPVTAAGTYTIQVSGAGNTTGAFTTQLALNAAFQTEQFGTAGSDDTVAGAQDISGSFVDLGGGMSRGAVLGRVPGGVVPGDVLVNERGPNDIALFDNNGNLIRKITNPALGAGVISGVELGPDSSVYVGVDTRPGTGQGGEILHFDLSGTLLGTIHLPNESFSRFFFYPFGFDVAPDGTFWVPQPNTSNVLHLDAAGNLLRSYALPSGAVPEDLAVRADGQVFLADPQFGLVRQLDPGTGNVSTFASVAVPIGLSFASAGGNGDLLVSDLFNGVRFFSASGQQDQLVAAFGVNHSDDDPGGNVFVPSFGFGTLRKFDAAGHLLFNKGLSGSPTHLSVVGIDAPPPPPPDTSDYYSFTLTAGQTATVALTDLGRGQAALALEDGGGHPLALARAVDTNVNQVISNFLARTTGTYYVHVTGNAVRYSVVVTRGADFDTEDNSTLAGAQTIGPAQGALGYTSPSFTGETFEEGNLSAYHFLGASNASLTSQAAHDGALGLAAASLTDWMYRDDSTVHVQRGDVISGWMRSEGPPGGRAYLGFGATAAGTLSVVMAPNTGTFIIQQNPFYSFSDLAAVPQTWLPDHWYRVEVHWALNGDITADLFDSDGTTLLNTVSAHDDTVTGGGIAFRAFGSTKDFDTVGKGGAPNDFYQVSLAAGDTLQLATATPGGGPGQFANALDPALRLYGPGGSLVAADDNSAADGRNARLTYTAPAAGVYAVSVVPSPLTAAPTVGEYVLQAQGATGPLPPFDVTGTNPPAGALLRSVPSVTVDFNDSVYLGSLTAAALTADGLAATGFTVNNDHEVTWTLPALSGSGDDVPHTIALAAGALTNIHGTPVDAFSETVFTDNLPPRVIATSIEEGAVLPVGGLTYQVTFSEPIVTSLVKASSFDLYGDFRDVHYAPTSFGFDPTQTVLTITYATSLPDDRYTLTLFSKDIQDRVFYHLDGEPRPSRPPSVPSGDGVEGGDFFIDFALDFATAPYLTPLTGQDPPGSLIYDPTVTDVISYAGDTHSYTLNVNPGQTLTAVAHPGLGGVQATLALYSPSNVLVGSAAAPAAGADAVLQTVPISVGGTYTVVVGGASGSLGLYTAQIVLNAAVEADAHGGPGNDTLATAQDLSGSSVALLGGADRLAVLGSFTGKDDYYSFPLSAGQSATLAWKAAAPPPLLGPRTDYAAGAYPQSVVFADLNHDGFPDMIAVNTNSNSVTVRLNNGDGTFGPALTLSTGLNTPEAVAVGDVTGDGIPDIVVSSFYGNFGSGSVTVFPGHGDGTFGAPITSHLAYYATGIALADVNGDGKLDVVQASYYDWTVTVGLGNGDGTFTPAGTYAVGASPWQVAVGDLNGDGRPDVVTANVNGAYYGNGNVSVLLNKGDGTFGPATAYNNTLDTTYGVAVADLNHDGRPDVVSTDLYGSNVAVQLNTGGGALGPARFFATGAQPVALAVGDVNGDGVPDLATANYNGASVSVLPGRGDGTFGPAVTAGTGSFPLSVAVADLNRDGFADVAAGVYYNTVSVFLARAAQADLQLVDASGHVLATGTAGPANVDEVIDRFTAPSAGTYYARITGRASAGVSRDYDLVVTRGATFGQENNDDPAHAQDLSGTGGVLAALTRPPTINPGTGFDGLSADNNPSLLSPPDATVAVGPGQVVEATNTALRVTDKAGNNLLTEQLSALFQPLGTSFLTDPQVAYDDNAGRWYVSILDVNPSSSFSDVLLAVSEDSNPLDGFNEMHRIHVGPGDFLDFDKLGFNNDAVVITANDFYYGYYETGLEVIAIDKSTLLDGKNSTFADYLSQRDPSNFRAMVPAQMHGSKPGDPMYFVEEAGYGNGHAARVVTMPVVLTAAPTFTDTDIPVAAYGYPRYAQQPGGYVATNDTTFTRADWRNGKLVSAQTVSEPDDGYTTARVRWYEFDTTGAAPALVQQGSVHPGPGVNTYFGTAALDANGDVGVTYMESSATEYVSVYVTGRWASDPLGTLAPGTLVKAGTSYLDGFGRAGDYSGIALDPADGLTFWAANEYKGSSFWNTYVTSFQAAPRNAEDWYRFSLPADAIVRLTTATPGAGPGQPGNLLNPSVELYDSAGHLLTSGTTLADGRNEQLAFAAHGGSYRAHVVGQNGTTGEYFLNLASTPLPAGLLLLDPSGQGALNGSGKGSLVVGGGGTIVVDSKSAAAAIDSGSSNVVAGEIDVTGVPGTQATGGGTFVGMIKSGVAATPDPLASLAVPAPPAPTYPAVVYSGSAPLVLKPGTYTGGINLSGQGVVTLLPGLYYMQGGGFVFSGQGSLTGYDVLIYNAPASGGDVINLSGQGAVTLTAPTDGTYAGVTLFQDRSSKNPVTLSGGSGLNLTGTVYAAAAAVNLSGNGGLVGSRLIARDLVDSGNGTFKVNAGAQQLAAAGSTEAVASVLLGSAGDLRTGEVLVAVAGLYGDQAAAEQARIDDALATINDELAPLNVDLVLATGAAAAWADVHVYLASTSDIGGVADGVLGVTEGSDITLIDGWDYYTGADPSAIGAGQYDFQTVVTHELGHALGLGHSADPGSVMYPFLAPADVRRQLTAGDLTTIEQVDGGGPEPLRALPAAREAAALARPTFSPAGAPASVLQTPASFAGVTAPPAPLLVVTVAPPATTALAGGAWALVLAQPSLLGDGPARPAAHALTPPPNGMVLDGAASPGRRESAAADSGTGSAPVADLRPGDPVRLPGTRGIADSFFAEADWTGVGADRAGVIPEAAGPALPALKPAAAGAGTASLPVAEGLDVRGGAAAQPAVGLGLVLPLLAALPRHDDKAAVRLGKRRQVASRLLELADGFTSFCP